MHGRISCSVHIHTRHFFSAPVSDCYRLLAKMEWDHEMTWFAGLASLGLVLALLEIIRLMYTGIKKKEGEEQEKTLEV